MTDLPLHTELLAKLSCKSTTIGVIGLGYFSLTLWPATVRNGLNDFGFRIDVEKPRLLTDRKTYLKHISDAQIGEMVDTGRFEATSDFERLSDRDILVICVPTALTRHWEPDLSSLVTTSE